MTRTTDARAAYGFVGSANLTRTGLRDGVEWTLATSHGPDVPALLDRFDALWADPRSATLTSELVADYRQAPRPTGGEVAVVEAQPDLSYRATAKVVGTVDDGDRLAAMVNVNGKGRCAITLDPKDRSGGAQPYQGIVALHGDDGAPLQAIADVLEHL